MNRQIDRHLSTEADRIGGSAASAISFGPFRLLATQRLLLDGDRFVRLGCRALDILIALAERPGELVSKRELMAVVWPDTLVVEANLTVHVAALRRALGDGQAGNRYIVNSPGRGYHFVAPVTFVDQQHCDTRTSLSCATSTPRRCVAGRRSRGGVQVIMEVSGQFVRRQGLSASRLTD